MQIKNAYKSDSFDNDLVTARGRLVSLLRLCGSYPVCQCQTPMLDSKKETKGKKMRINIEPYTIEWNGGHYGNVFVDGVEIDCFSFAWEWNCPTAFDFSTSAARYLEGY